MLVLVENPKYSPTVVTGLVFFWALPLASGGIWSTETPLPMSATSFLMTPGFSTAKRPRGYSRPVRIIKQVILLRLSG